MTTPIKLIPKTRPAPAIPKNRLPINYLTNLPLELLYDVILTNLRTSEIINLCKTSKYFNDVICNQNYIWQKLYPFLRDGS